MHSAETFNNPDTLAMILEDNGHDLKIKLEKLRDETSVVSDGTGVIYKILPLPPRGLVSREESRAPDLSRKSFSGSIID